jgi:uncharacterized protein
MMEKIRSSALITGASSGIGAVYADRLARRGYDLILTARRTDLLAQLATELKAKYNVNVQVIPADLATEHGIQAVERRIEDDPPIDLLINNAGIPAGGPISGASADAVDRIININVRTVARLGAVAARRMKDRGTGAIVNVASVMALIPEVAQSLYGPTKAFVISFSQNLQAELAGHGVYVQVVLPAATRTDIWAIAGRDVNEIAGMMEVDDMVDAAMVGFDQREAVTLPSLPNVDLWNSYEALRHQIAGNVAKERPAERYRKREVIE